jgi:alpha-tubulin suppressor-like RCC1 family protein
MGSNNHGQLGIGEPLQSKNSPILVEKLPPARFISAVTCGGNHTFVILEDENSVYAWGEGTYGVLGINVQQD